MKERIAVLGFGQLGQALARGIQRSKNKIKIIASVRSGSKAEELSKKLNLEVYSQNKRVVEAADLLVLAVKPKQVAGVLKEVQKSLTKKKLLISVCASITLDDLRKAAGPDVRLIRAMPNLPSVIGEGICVLTPGESATSNDLESAKEIFGSMGRVIVLEDESLLDAVTALSACGPAFIFTIIESLIDAGVKVGLPRDASRELVLQTMVGSAKMVQELKAHPAALKDQVTTPAGCTIDGLQALEEGKLRATLLQAIIAATKRSRELRSYDR